MSKIQYKKDPRYAKQTEHSKLESFLLLMPLFLVAAVVPLIVKMHTYDSRLSQFDWSSNSKISTDYFLYYKQWFFVFICTVVAAIVIYRIVFKKVDLKLHKYLIPLAIYSLLALLSTIFSRYRSFGFSGIFDQFENVFCLIGYTLIVYYAYLIIESEYELKLLINAIAIGALLIGLIGSLQTFGKDPFSTEFFRSLIAESGVDVSSLSTSSENTQVISTLANPNYVGLYTCMIIPLFAVILFSKNHIIEYILYSLVLLTSSISLLGSQSKAGLFSISFSVLLVMIFNYKKILKLWYLVIPFASLLIVVFLLVNKYSENAFVNNIVSAMKVSKTAKPDISDISTDRDGVRITYKGNTLLIKESDTEYITFQDDKSNSVEYNLYQHPTNENVLVIEFLDERFKDITVGYYINKDLVDFSLYISNTYFSFSKSETTGDYYYYNQHGKYTPIKTPETSLFDGYERFATGRGYIWSRTLPLIKKNLILGSGADTFMIEFPQYDYIGLYNYGFNEQLITKPHSLYLQISIQTGLLSLLSLLVFFVVYLVKCTKLYFGKKLNTISSRIGFAAFIAIIAFLISSLTNDSCITVTPVFWLIVGIGFTANMLYSKQK